MNYAIEMRGITKTFGTVVANNHIHLQLKQGEILALLGENGSGKTTLMNMLSGIYQPTNGEIFVDGKPVSIHSPEDAKKLGIGMVHQHFKLVDVFSAADNIWLGVENKPYQLKSKLREIDALPCGNDDPKAAARMQRKRILHKTKLCFQAFGYHVGQLFLSKKRYATVKDICAKFGFDLDPKKKVYDMTVSEKQTVEILKVLYYGAKVIILDEPTAVLTVQEITKLFAVLRKMKEDGHSIIIITHKLNEVMEISDRVMIMRKGEYIDTVETAQTNEQALTDMMVGQKVNLQIDRPRTHFDRPLLEIRNLTVKNDEGSIAIDGVNFYIRGGEILGIAGISGCGQKELCEAIAGLRRIKSGEINHKGDSIIGLSPQKIIAKGISMSFIPEDRLGMGLAPSMSITDNMMLKTYRKSVPNLALLQPISKKRDSEKQTDALRDTRTASKKETRSAVKAPRYRVVYKKFEKYPALLWPFVDRVSSREMAEGIIDELNIVTPSSKTPVRRLSGGNVQKVLVGREIQSAPNVIVTAYPVRGLDINSSYAIYNILNEQKKRGVGILFVGEDLDVMLALCDKILVLCHGKIMGVVHAEKATKEQLGLMMTGALDLSEEKSKEYGIAKDSNIPQDLAEEPNQEDATDE